MLRNTAGGASLHDQEVAATMAGHKGVEVTAEIYNAAMIERKRAALKKKKAD